MKFPITIFHRNHTAKIYAKSPRDGAYRTSWYAEGKRVQRNFKKLTDAKAASLAALKSIARQSILESKGWSILRVWSTDFFSDQEGTYQILKDQIQNLLNGKKN